MCLSIRGVFVRFLVRVVIFIGIVVLSGCFVVIYKVIGDIMINIGEDVMVFYFFIIDDFKIVCVLGEVLIFFLFLFLIVIMLLD